jgi:hypothetical protein
MFIVGRDRFFVITLAGAADVILSRLALDKDKSNFTDTLMQDAIRNGAATRTRVDHGREINDVLFTNDMKHMDEDEDGFVDWTQMSAPNRCELHGPHGEQIESSQGIEGIGTSASATAAWRRVLSLP